MFLDAAIALAITLASVYLAVSALSAIVAGPAGGEGKAIELLATLEKAMSACVENGGVAQCNENYYFYGVVDENAVDKIGEGNRCMSRLAEKQGRVARITACME